MAVIELRNATIRIINYTATRDNDGDYSHESVVLGPEYECRAQRKDGSSVKADWTDREERVDGENFYYTHKVFMDEIPPEFEEGMMARIAWEDGKYEDLRIKGIKPQQLSHQVWLTQ